MKSKVFALFCLLFGEALLFWAFEAWFVMATVLFLTLYLLLYPYKSNVLLPQILLKKSKIILLLVFWTCLFFTLHSFVESLLCLNCMQGIQKANAAHFWDIQNPSVWTWMKNIYRTYTQPALLVLILSGLTVVFYLSQRTKRRG